MKSLYGRVAIGVAAAVAVYVGFSIWADTSKVEAALARFSARAAVWGCLLAAGNYALRWVRWEFYLRRLGLRIAPKDSVLVFLAGFALTVTPGKVGEAVKALLLRQSHGIPAARTVPVVIAERVIDLVALLLLTLVGIFTFHIDRRFLGAGAVAVGLGLAVIGSETLGNRVLAICERLPGVARAAPKLRELRTVTAALLRPGPLLAATALSLASWFLECITLWVVVQGFPGAAIGLRAATFTYAAMTIAGALSFLPGGLGVTEGGMLALLAALGTGIDRGTATAAVLVTRACTLWFAVAIGLPCFVAYARRTRASSPVEAATAATKPL